MMVQRVTMTFMLSDVPVKVLLKMTDFVSSCGGPGRVYMQQP